MFIAYCGGGYRLFVPKKWVINNRGESFYEKLWYSEKKEAIAVNENDDMKNTDEMWNIEENDEDKGKDITNSDEL